MGNGPAIVECQRGHIREATALHCAECEELATPWGRSLEVLLDVLEERGMLKPRFDVYGKEVLRPRVVADREQIDQGVATLALEHTGLVRDLALEVVRLSSRPAPTTIRARGHRHEVGNISYTCERIRLWWLHGGASMWEEFNADEWVGEDEARKDEVARALQACRPPGLSWLMTGPAAELWRPFLAALASKDVGNPMARWLLQGGYHVDTANVVGLQGATAKSVPPCPWPGFDGLLNAWRDARPGLPTNHIGVKARYRERGPFRPGPLIETRDLARVPHNAELLELYVEYSPNSPSQVRFQLAAAHGTANLVIGPTREKGPQDYEPESTQRIIDAAVNARWPPLRRLL